MDLSGRIYEELLEASESVDDANAMVLLIGYNDDHAMTNVMTNVIGESSTVLGMMINALDKTLKRHPSGLERELRMKAAEIILRGKDDAAE